MTPAVTASRRFRSFRIRLNDTCPKCGGHGAQADVVAGDSVQGHRLLHHRLRRRSDKGSAPKSDGGESGSREARRPTRPAASDDSDAKTEKSDSGSTERERLDERRRRPASSAASAVAAGADAGSPRRARQGRRRTSGWTARSRSSGLEVCGELARRDPAGAARSRRPPSGIRACCRCRGGRL